MSYTDKSLLPNETVVHRTRLSKIIFVTPALFFAIGIFFFVVGTSNAPALGFLAMIFLLLGLLITLSRWIAYATSEFAVTDRRVIIKTGLLRRRTLEMQLAKLEAIAVNQGLAGRIFGYGNITVTGSGGTKEPFKMIQGPLDFRRATQAATN